MDKETDKKIEEIKGIAGLYTCRGQGNNEKSMNVIIVHGCGDSEEDAQSAVGHWMPWLERELCNQNVEVSRPMMPHPWAPAYEDHKAEFEKLSVNEESVLIGHSCGAAFLVRWLGESRQKVKKLILVAPWKIPDDEVKERFYNYPIDPAVKELVGEIVMFTSDDEEEEGKESLRIFHEALGGKIIDLPEHGHYTFGDMGTEEFPELLGEILGNPATEPSSN